MSSETIRVVLISDTHNDHRSLEVPDGDILIHAGDFTCFGKSDHLQDFNSWLAELPHQYKIVVNGNHDCNSPWKNQTPSILTNAIFLSGTNSEIEIRGRILKIHGTQFFWAVNDPSGNPHYNLIEDDVNILISHQPVYGFLDFNTGCPSLLVHCKRINREGSLKLVVSGHIHSGTGAVFVDENEELRPALLADGSQLPVPVCSRELGEGERREANRGLVGVTFVNASSCTVNRKCTKPPIVLDI